MNKMVESLLTSLPENDGFFKKIRQRIIAT